MGPVILIIVLLIFVVLPIVLILIARNIFDMSCNVKNKKLMDVIKKRGINLENCIIEPNVQWLKEQDIKDYYMKSRDGLDLHAVYLPAQNPYRTIICIHAYRGSYTTDFSAIIRYLNANHSNVLLVEQRGHGESKGKYITYGAKEKYDIVDWVNFTLSKIEDKYPIYLYGISMGCTTALLSLGCGINNRVRGVIADSGYSSMGSMMSEILQKWYKLPTFPLLYLFDLFCKLKAGFSMSDTDTKEALKENEVPILFIHGEDDTFVPGEQARINFSRTNGPKDLVWISGANHAEAIIKNPELYHDKLEYFFKTYK